MGVRAGQGGKDGRGDLVPVEVARRGVVIARRLPVERPAHPALLGSGPDSLSEAAKVGVHQLEKATTSSRLRGGCGESGWHSEGSSQGQGGGPDPAAAPSSSSGRPRIMPRNSEGSRPRELSSSVSPQMIKQKIWAFENEKT